jgi:hypothetical protein
MYIALARRFNWTEAQVNATDPDYIDELMVFIKAEADEQAFQNKQR